MQTRLHIAEESTVHWLVNSSELNHPVRFRVWIVEDLNGLLKLNSFS